MDRASLTGLQLMQAMLAGASPPPAMATTLGFQLVSVEEGQALFSGEPSERYYNPMGMVHGGWPATLLDSCMGCAVQTSLPAGQAYTTLEFKIDLLRRIMADTGTVFAEGRVVRVGRRVAVADGVLRDTDGRQLARGSTTCLVFPLDGSTT